LLRDILKNEDASLKAIRDVIGKAAPDILVLTDFDYDLEGRALAAFVASLDAPFPYRFAIMPNAGVATGLDIDGNGRTGEARDAMGYGRFAGDGGMAVLSRYEIVTSEVHDLSTLLWRDLADATLPQNGDAPFFEPAVLDVLRLSSAGHWIVPVLLPDGTTLNILTFAATPPVFDGPEDMNGLRSRDELRLWEHVLDGKMGPIPANFIMAGLSNLDPNAGQGDRAAMAGFLARGDLQDRHAGTINADWGPESAGKMRVSYVLPAATWTVTDASGSAPAQDIAGPHTLVWVDIMR